MDDTSEEGEGTAKQKEQQASLSSPPPSDWRSSISQNRISTLFDSWMHPTSIASPVGTISRVEKKDVSEPVLLAQHTGDGLKVESPSEELSSNAAEPSIDGKEFEDMLASIHSYWGLRACSK